MCVVLLHYQCCLIWVCLWSRVSSDLRERPSHPWSDVHHPEVIRCHSLRIRYPSSNSNRNQTGTHVRCGLTRSLKDFSKIKSAQLAETPDNEQKSSFLVYETVCSGQCCAHLHRNDATSNFNEFCPFSLIIMGWFVCFLTVRTFTHIHPGEKPTQSARGSPQGTFEEGNLCFPARL